MNDAFPTAALRPVGVRFQIDGYGAILERSPDESPDTTTEEYASEQALANVRKTIDYIQPLLSRQNARVVLDVGCGIGVMVRTLLDLGYDAYGTDLAGLTRFWSKQALPRERMFIVDPLQMKLPFADNSIDLAFTLGVIEHVGTTDGHADRRPDYRAVRHQWVQEVMRVVKPGGAALIGGPNRGFPIDVAHGPDSRANGIERGLSRIVGATVHKPWGENFLWGYGDLKDYLVGIPCDVRPLSVDGYVGYSRVPSLIRPLITGYVNKMPKALLGTGFNPWMMALVEKRA
jgi:SAM-dependent methyltransferase